MVQTTDYGAIHRSGDATRESPRRGVDGVVPATGSRRDGRAGAVILPEDGFFWFSLACRFEFASFPTFSHAKAHCSQQNAKVGRQAL
jgi:hypothetical protein